MPDFSVAYWSRGKRYDATINAPSWDTAEEHLSAIRAHGSIDGEIIATLPAGPVALPLTAIIVKIWIWLKGGSHG